MFRPEDLRVVDPNAWLKKNISRFLPHGYDQVSLMTWLLDEAFRVGGGRVSLERRGEWLLLESTRDWIGGWSDPFHSLTPLSDCGANAVSLVAATVTFENSVCTWSDQKWSTLVGRQAPDYLLPAEVQRAIAIRSEVVDQ